MASFLVDENLPRSLAPSLRKSGFEAQDVRELGLGGKSDDDVIEYARSNSRALITRDMDFSSILRFPLGTHAGIIVLRFPMTFTPAMLFEAVRSALSAVSDRDILGNVVILQPDRIRFRSKESGQDR